MSKIKTALISVSNKEGIVQFAKGLQKLGVKIISTGGTYSKLRNSGVKAIPIEEVTGFPEMLEGRVKTLHPKIHAGILAKRNKKHLSELKKQGIEGIDLIVVNLYPFKETLEKTSSLEKIIEEIDIGGPTLIRAAAKNYENAAVVVDYTNYNYILNEIKKGRGSLNKKVREGLAVKAFQHVAEYDAIISGFFNKRFIEGFPEKLVLSFDKLMDLRYGENPHQKASLYKESLADASSTVNAVQLHGKELSFNNLFDLNAAVELVKEFPEPTAVIIKHGNPCGVASGKTLHQAFTKALECDAESAFGGIIALNRKIDDATAKEITSFFNEVVIAPSFEEKALKLLKEKKNLRIMKLDLNKKEKNEIEFKKIDGGLLVQEKDEKELKERELKFVSEKKPSEKELQDILFAFKVVKHVKSNAIVIAKEKATIGIGVGQTSRVRAVDLALKQAGIKSEGAVLASDGFFPFRDSIDLAAGAGITAVIEPGGSIKDKEVIEEANEKGIALIFSGARGFKH